ncbi:CBS domain-containing protein [Vitiosangium sp. GDMCC 1.1324]|uniref:CBS domain-containing protein n=1 Tax=Vitiosangium sp. (strain GDMCC 1.1324) TaxID=2138576 RepID=UPI001E5820AE|nr:CBS domain-containing protein [Vitiosangium sp. GDMCC 1.1324]
MKRDVELVRPYDNLHTAARKMRDKGVGFLPVVDDQGKPVGTLTDRDITVRVSSQDHRPSNVSVREAMSPGAVTCRRWDDIHIAENLMARNQKSRIICVDESGVLIGVISLSDIAKMEEGPRAAEVLREVAQREAHPTVV